MGRKQYVRGYLVDGVIVEVGQLQNYLKEHEAENIEVISEVVSMTYMGISSY